ncbi:MAG TPA: radical SAM protein [Gemmatimonadaceae bacterium]|nr:radical SAM protein [Gemmatimonadaceae bacterium]
MLSRKFSPWHLVPFSYKYARLRLQRRPVLVHFEVTMRCNAACDFCDYWKTDPAMKAKELNSFVDAARAFNPMLITWTGGEPLLRRDLESLVGAVDRAIRTKYTTLITHGAMLSLDRARSLWDAGIGQFSVSLDYPDERHDAARGIPGLARKILTNAAAIRAAGMTVRFNTVIKHDNLEDIMPLVHEAERMRVGMNLSVYTDFKNGNTDHLLREAHFARVDELVRELLAFKRRRRGIISNSDHYLANIPRYLRGEMKEPCLSGQDTVHIDPYGHIRRCPDFPADGHWSTYAGYEPIACNKCFYACRGEAQAPLRPNRFLDLVASA